jgi:thiol-disulfide isomerase/thioredoxin
VSRTRRGPIAIAIDLLAVALIAYALYRIFVAPRYLNPASARPAPHVTYASVDGPPFVLTQHRGRVVFLDFFASWCEPCKVSLPIVERFARAHPEVDVIPVDEGEPRAVAAAFARAKGLRDVALDPHLLAGGYFQIEGLPTMVVIDPQGRIRATWPGLNPAIAINMAHAEAVLNAAEGRD